MSCPAEQVIYVLSHAEPVIYVLSLAEHVISMCMMDGGSVALTWVVY